MVSQQSGLSHLCQSTDACNYPHLCKLSSSDGLDYKLVEDIPQINPDIHSQWPATEIVTNFKAPIGITICVQPFGNEEYNLIALFGAHNLQKLCHSCVDTNVG